MSEGTPHRAPLTTVQPGDSRWSIVVFAAREAPAELLRTIQAARSAAQSNSVIEVLVNGNETLADEIGQDLIAENTAANPPQAKVRIWFVPLGDKAHAWNSYIHQIYTDSTIVFFIDGYVRVLPESFRLLSSALTASTTHLAATGTPTVGRNSKSLRKQLLEHGGIHGNLFALKKETIRLLKEMNFKLPLGLYRTDPLLGAALSFNLSPATNDWNPKGRVLVHPEASWITDERSLFRYRDVVSQIKRALRQGQGHLENAALRGHFSIRKNPVNGLPETMSEMVLNWASEHPDEYRKTRLRNPVLTAIALRKLRAPRDWRRASEFPECRYEIG